MQREFGADAGRSGVDPGRVVNERPGRDGLFLRSAKNFARAVIPDPLYPRNRGYQFKGYFLDNDSVPTFMYRSGDVAIEDRSDAAKPGERPVLKRTLAFTSPTAQTIWFRALTGKIEAVGEGAEGLMKFV